MNDLCTVVRRTIDARRTYEDDTRRAAGVRGFQDVECATEIDIYDSRSVTVLPLQRRRDPCAMHNALDLFASRQLHQLCATTHIPLHELHPRPDRIQEALQHR